MSESLNHNPGIVSEGDSKNVRLAHIMYALHALSAITGVVTSASIIGSFIFGLPSSIAVVMNYFTRSRVQGTWLESHWGWQLRTFWFTALWTVIALALALTFIGLVIAIPLIIFISLWLLYRVVRGWIALQDRLALPMG